MPLSLLAQRVGPIHSLPLALHRTHQPGVKGQLPFNQDENLISGVNFFLNHVIYTIEYVFMNSAIKYTLYISCNTVNF